MNGFDGFSGLLLNRVLEPFVFHTAEHTLHDRIIPTITPPTHAADPDWKAALESINGIYLLTDILTGKRYVGSAYGEGGIWSRWCDYVFTGHGGNIELSALVTTPDLKYCRANFRFALLEHRPVRIADELIFARENFWKQLLLTRGAQGLNRN